MVKCFTYYTLSSRRFHDAHDNEISFIPIPIYCSLVFFHDPIPTPTPPRLEPLTLIIVLYTYRANMGDFSTRPLAVTVHWGPLILPFLDHSELGSSIASWSDPENRNGGHYEISQQQRNDEECVAIEPIVLVSPLEWFQGNVDPLIAPD